MEPVDLYNCGAYQDENGGNDDEQEYDANLDTYEWYSYQITQQQAEDVYEVCQTVVGLDGNHGTVYDKKNSGSLYKYKKNWNSSNGMRPGGVATLVIFLVVVVAAAAAFFAKKSKQNDRKTPLINANDGSMA